MNKEKLQKLGMELCYSIFDNCMDAILLTTPDGRIHHANPATCAMFQWTVEELCEIGREGILDWDNANLEELVKEREKTGKVKGEFNFVRRDGSKFPGEFTSVIYQDENDFSWTTIVIRDISIVKQARENEKKAKRMVLAQEFAHSGYWEHDFISGEYPWSDELFRILGFKPQEFIPTLNDFMELVHPDDKDLVKNAIKQRLNGNECEHDLRILKADNEIIWVHEKVGYEWDEVGKLVRMYGVVGDITQRKLNEAKLKESEEKFRELAENIGEVIWVRTNKQMIYISPAYEKVWGMTCQSLYENPDSFIDSIHPEDKERIIQAYLSENNSKGIFNEQYRIIRPEGTIRWIWARTLPIFDDNGRVVRTVGIGDDITELIHYEESVRKAKATEIANKTKSMFLANMSHEIRTPLNGILGMAQLLGMRLKDENKEMIDILLESGNALLNIINDILDLSKIEAGKVSLNPEEFDINLLVNDVNNVMKTLIDQKGLEYKCHIDKEIEGDLTGDSDRLKQVLFNLLGNAVKFTEYGGIELSITKGKLFEDKLQLVFSIKDTGIGIADDKIVKLFTAFMQCDDSLTKKYGGAGLGLAISKQLVNMMDGKISVKSKLGCGSNFTFSSIFKMKVETKEVRKINKEKVSQMAPSNSTALL